MRKVSATKLQGICGVLLLSLTLLLGFTATPALRYNQERQAAPTELVSRNSSQHRACGYPIYKNHSQPHFFISSREIVTRVALFHLKVKVEFAENLKSLMLSKILKVTLVYWTPSFSQLADAYLLHQG